MESKLLTQTFIVKSTSFISLYYHTLLLASCFFSVSTTIIITFRCYQQWHIKKYNHPVTQIFTFLSCEETSSLVNYKNNCCCMCETEVELISYCILFCCTYSSPFSPLLSSFFFSHSFIHLIYLYKVYIFKILCVCICILVCLLSLIISLI